MSAALRERLKSEALAQGFARVGVCTLDALRADGARLRAWIGAGRHGAMGYLARHDELREHPERLLPGARSALVVGAAYAPAREPGVAAYAQRDDYHRRMTAALERVLAATRAAGHALEGVVAVDTKPVLERALAARAGLGWIGKNTMLLDEEHGPWLMLGALVVDVELEADPPAKPRCGTCTSCLDACPTRAFVAPYVLDARRCLSYWSIEHRGAWPDEFRTALGERVFGCDDCLTSCPFGPPRTTSGDALLPLADELRALTPAETLRRCADGFTRSFGRFAIARAGKAGLIRNAVTALGNGATSAEARALVREHLQHPAASVRAHAGWALARIGDASDASRLRAALDAEADAETRADLGRSLGRLTERVAQEAT